MLEESSKTPGEVAATLSFIPNARGEQGDDSDEEDEMAPGEFIFIVDRSGSMGFGSNRIDVAKKALTLFLQSIPQRSKFEIVSFGSHHQGMFNGPTEYNEKTQK